MLALVVGNVASLALVSESFKLFLLKKCASVIDLPIIYKSNRNFVYFVHYNTSIYCTVVKHSNFETHDPQHSKSAINNQTLTNRALESSDLSQQLIIKRSNSVHNTNKKKKKKKQALRCEKVKDGRLERNKKERKSDGDY